MELSVIQQPINNTVYPEEVSNAKPFIEANTVEVAFEEVRDHHLIPVFLKDNEPVISHIDFINATAEVVEDIFQSERILKPAIRLSHPIKGREYRKQRISLQTSS
jgi:hypothetical protein